MSLLFADLPETLSPDQQAYKVLARKYRPQTFSTMIGQDALVRTLTNAIDSGRLAQAWMLTGIRGVGKTTTARIIARALNCVGADGTGGPTPEPCGVCGPCSTIAQERCVDVMEMDAASRTGVDDIREILDGVRYAPTQVRYKVYIIDEVHMLSKNAFNALLKTLEEPPSNVKFIFATTEIRKVPITVLSRCQRFDLKRVEHDVLALHFKNIAGLEQATIEDEALHLIARAADGSVRDGLSLLDQAIALGEGHVAADTVRAMLGLADRAAGLDLLQAIVEGDAPTALAHIADMHRAGADPVVMAQDLLEFTHIITRLKLVPESGATLPALERERGSALAAQLSVPQLTRLWQMILKAIGELQHAPQPLQALEMMVMRLVYASDLPTPGDLVKQWQAQKPVVTAQGTAPSPAPLSSGAHGFVSTQPSHHDGAATMMRTVGGPDYVIADAPPVPVAPVSSVPLARFEDVVALFQARNEMVLYGYLYEAVQLVKFAPGRLEINPDPIVPRDFAGRIAAKLQEWTGARWVVSVSNMTGAPSLADQMRTERAENIALAAETPLVREALQLFTGAKIIQLRQNNIDTPTEEIDE